MFSCGLKFYNKDENSFLQEWLSNPLIKKNAIFQETKSYTNSLNIEQIFYDEHKTIIKYF